MPEGRNREVVAADQGRRHQGGVATWDTPSCRKMRAFVIPDTVRALV
jgi:hypothetical protein